jgi:O-antigen ligase
MRILVALIALAVLAYCAYGFLCTYEPPGFIGWRIGFGIAGAACLGVVTWALTSGQPSAK